jgi:hypothetical protein
MARKGGAGLKRMSVGFPPTLYDKLDAIAERQHRSIASVVIEACDLFVHSGQVRTATLIAEQSPEYQAILKKLAKDLGLPQDPLQ